MHLGERKVRSAGRLGGSVEATLPVKGGFPKGIPCRLSLRGGLVPETFLEPDPRGAVPIFERLRGLPKIGPEKEVDENGNLAEAACAVDLFSSATLGVLSRLACADALVIQQNLESHDEPRPRALEPGESGWCRISPPERRQMPWHARRARGLV